MIYWIIVNYHSTDLIRRLIQSIAASESPEYRIIIVNNSPGDRSIWQLESERIIILDSPENVGFGRGCNLGLQWVWERDRDGCIWLINPDAIVPKQTPGKVLAVLHQNPQLSILGTAVYEPDGGVWFGGGEFIIKTGHIFQLQEIPPSNLSWISTTWVTACSLLISLPTFRNCPKFDPNYFLYYEDFDLCLRYRKLGHQIGITPQIGVIHYPSSITGKTPHLKLQHSIYSYLLSLDKHAGSSVLFYRLLRISIVAFFTFPVRPQVSLAKLRGVWRYIRRSI